MTDSLSPKKTLQSAVIAYVSERRRTGSLAPPSATSVGNVLLRFAAIAGDDLPVAKLRERHVVKYLAEIGVGPSTARARLSMIRTFCRWARAKGWLEVDPTLGVRGPLVPRRLPRALKRPQVENVFSGLPDARAVVIVLLMVQEGLRCCEVSRLQLGDIDLANDELRVIGKFGKERVLPLSQESKDAIIVYTAEHPCSLGPLVRSYNDARKPIHPSYISKLVADWMRQSGVKMARYDRVSAHALRHTALTDMLLNGAELLDVKEAAGHASLTTTQIYLPLVVKGLREAMGGRSYRRANPSATAENHAEAS